MSQEIVPTPKSSPALPASSFPGFALPEAALHSIPLPAEFDQLVRAAIEENHVESPFPKFFNGVFRRQGVVNKHTIRALESVGQSLSHLAREIESRDRVLEKLTAHLNTYGEHVQRGQMTLAHFSQELASQLSDVAGNAQARLNEVAERSRTHVDSLVAKARSTERRLGDLQGLNESLSSQILALREENERQRVESIRTLKAELDQLGAARQAAEMALGKLRSEVERVDRRVGESLPATEERVFRRLVELTTPVQRDINAVKAELETQREGATGFGRRLEELTQQIETERAATVQTQPLIESLQQRLVDFEQKVGDAVQGAEQVRSDWENGWRDQEQKLETQLQGVSEETRANEARLEQRIDALEKKLEEVLAHRDPDAQSREDSLAAALKVANHRLDTVSTELTQLHSHLSRLAEITAELSSRLSVAESVVHGPLGDLTTLLPALTTHLDHLRALAPGTERDGVLAQAAEAGEEARKVREEGFYVALEARFRGSRALIRERQSIYLPFVEQARSRVEMYPPRPIVKSFSEKAAAVVPAANGVIDLGCGRGEWIELLKDNKISVLGVDQNRYFLRTCRERGCEVVESDLMEFLRAAPSESVAAITSFHVIEHLPLPVFEEMIGHVFRVLRRGGVAIFETPNPNNLISGSVNFLLDPTHLRPVHPELARLMFEMGGFATVRLEYLQPCDPSSRVEDKNDKLAERFNHFFYGPQDYAVIGVKP